MKLTKEEKEKVKRILKSLKRVDKAHRNLEVARYRRKQAEKGNLYRALFGKPKKTKRRKKKNDINI